MSTTSCCSSSNIVLFVHVLMLIILGNFDHFAILHFFPIARLAIVPLLCGRLQTAYASRLPVPSQRDRVVNGLKLSHLPHHVLG